MSQSNCFILSIFYTDSFLSCMTLTIERKILNLKKIQIKLKFFQVAYNQILWL